MNILNDFKQITCQSETVIGYSIWIIMNNDVKEVGNFLQLTCSETLPKFFIGEHAGYVVC